MALGRNTDTSPQRRPTLNTDEQRIADAVVAALEPRFASLTQRLDDRFASLTQRLDDRFVNHMTEIEGYYAERDRARDEELSEIKGDVKAILSALND